MGVMMNYILDPQLIKLARKAKTEADLLLISRNLGIELTEEQEQLVFNRLHAEQEELARTELSNVSGGCVMDEELLAAFS